MTEDKPPRPTEAERRQLAQARRRRVRRRAGPAAPPEPRIVRVDPIPLRVNGVDTGVYEPLLVPDRALKDTTGRYALRRVVTHLNQALGLHTLVAFHALQAALGTRVAAEAAFDALGLPSLTNLIRDGRRRLRDDTLFDTEDELQRFSVLKVEAHRRSIGTQRWHPAEYTRTELSAVRLVNVARVRAQSLLSVFEDIQRRHVGTARRGSSSDAASAEDFVVEAIDPKFHGEIQAAFDAHPASLHPGELWELAAHADINPVMLWPQHIARYAPILEVARFLGRVDHGVEGRLDASHAPLAASILKRAWGPFDDDRDHLANWTRTKFEIHFAPETLLAYLSRAERRKVDLISARGTRKLRLARRPRS